MKASTSMAAESAVGAGLLWKAGAALGAGVLGAAIMACMDPPATRKELFKQALVAGVGSMVFGPVALTVLGHFVPWLAASLETAVPIYFLVGALSWGAFGALVKLRKLVDEKAAASLAKKLGVDQ